MKSFIFLLLIIIACQNSQLKPPEPRRVINGDSSEIQVVVNDDEIHFTEIHAVKGGLGPNGKHSYSFLAADTSNIPRYFSLIVTTDTLKEDSYNLSGIGLVSFIGKNKIYTNATGAGFNLTVLEKRFGNITASFEGVLYDQDSTQHFISGLLSNVQMLLK